MSARISELEDAAEQARSRAAKLEKERNRLQIEIHEVVTELDEVTIHYCKQCIVHAETLS